MSKRKPQTKITRRESLKKIAITTYAAPVTLTLLTADQATAQSNRQQCSFTVVNNLSNLPVHIYINSVYIDDVPAGSSGPVNGNLDDAIMLSAPSGSTYWSSSGLTPPINTSDLFVTFDLNPCTGIVVTAEEPD